MPTQPIAMLTMLSPVWLMGLAAAVGLPVAAHLLSRVRYRQVAFPATRFVEQAVVETAQVNRPRHLWLMLLRILALACVVFAFTRPQWEAAAATPATTDGEALVIILDASASMRRTERGATLFDQARRRAIAAIESLEPARDTAVVILADRSPRMLLPEPTANRALLRERLAQAECTYETADLAGAVALAQAVLQDQGRAGRILVISDGQATRRSAEHLADHAPGVAITEHRVGAELADNVAVHLVDVSPYPPVLGREATLSVELIHFGQTAKPITLHAEGAGDRASLSLTLQPGAATTQTVTLTPTQLGTQAVRVWIDTGDVFDLDDEAGVVVETAFAREVHLFSDAALGEDTTASRIALALAPRRDDAAAVRVQRDEPHLLASSPEPSPVTLGCWVLTGIEQLPGEIEGAMRRHLEAGGGVVWVVDTPAARRVAQGLAFSGLRFSDASVSDAVVTAVRFDHSVLAVFEGPARASLVGQRLAGVADAQESDTAEVLMRSADGRPILALQRVGRGRLIIVNADLTPSKTDFASQPAFVAWVNELVAFAAPGPLLPLPLHPGDPLPQSLMNQHTLRPPDHGNTAHDSDNRIAAPGLYQGLDADGNLVAGVYAQLDPAESNFTQAPEIHAPPSSLDVQGGVSSLTHAGGRRPIELWPICIVGALLFVGLESLSLMSFARRGGGA
ncbi:BatA and WFA domain-containing protein [Phycisphaeraceae bacterium D3-23]